jgi:methoxymalonate biosynthesis acyl carrier protein
METDRARIKAFLSRKVRNHELRDDDDIFAMGFVNSLFAMQLVLFLEKEFGITIENEDLEIENFQSVNAVTNLIESKRLQLTAV